MPIDPKFFNSLPLNVACKVYLPKDIDDLVGKYIGTRDFVAPTRVKEKWHLTDDDIRYTKEFSSLNYHMSKYYGRNQYDKLYAIGAIKSYIQRNMTNNSHKDQTYASIMRTVCSMKFKQLFDDQLELLKKSSNNSLKFVNYLLLDHLLDLHPTVVLWAVKRYNPEVIDTYNKMIPNNRLVDLSYAIDRSLENRGFDIRRINGDHGKDKMIDLLDDEIERTKKRITPKDLRI